jgi:hypothetical protein
MKAKAILGLVLLLSFFTNKAAYAYDRTGHRIVAQIAEDNLTTNAKKQIQAILGKNGLTANANWADDVRSDHKFDYSTKWHYFDTDGKCPIAKSDSLFYVGTKSGNNLLFAIDSLIKVLKNNKNDVIALKYLIHFIGDMHQPLHLGHAADLGGNKIKVKWLKDSVNLHSVWDTYLINMEQLSFSEYAQYLLDSNRSSSLRIKSSNLLFSFKLCYTLSQKVYEYNYANLNAYSYKYTFAPEMNDLLLLGGFQLSAILNEIYT